MNLLVQPDAATQSCGPAHKSTGVRQGHRARRSSRMDAAIQVAGKVIIFVLFILLFVLPFVAPRYILRRFGRAPNWLNEAALSCPQCGSTEVVRLEANRFTLYPGYECRGCGVNMRPPGTRSF